MKIAVASTNGNEVNEHFGKAEKFLVYEVNDEELLLVDQRPVTPLSVGDQDHGFDAARFAPLAAALADCKKVFVTRIGVRPADELYKRGIEAVVYSGPIAEVPV